MYGVPTYMLQLSHKGINAFFSFLLNLVDQLKTISKSNQNVKPHITETDVKIKKFNIFTSFKTHPTTTHSITKRKNSF